MATPLALFRRSLTVGKLADRRYSKTDQVGLDVVRNVIFRSQVK